MTLNSQANQALISAFGKLGEHVGSVESDIDSLSLIEQLVPHDDGNVVKLGEFDVFNTSVQAASKFQTPFASTYGVDASDTGPVTFQVGLTASAANAVLAGNGEHTLPRRLEQGSEIALVTHSEEPIPEISETIAQEDERVHFSHIHVTSKPPTKQKATSWVTSLSKAHTEASRTAALTEQAERDELIFVDGPVYPPDLIGNLTAVNDGVGDATADWIPPARQAVQRRLDAYEQAITEEVPVIGIVKTIQTNELLRVMRERSQADSEIPNGWRNDSQLVDNLLPYARGQISFTSWFVKHNRLFAADDYLELKQHLPPSLLNGRPFSEFKRAFCYVRVPEINAIFRVDCPYAFVADPEDRFNITKTIMSRIAQNRDVPPTIDRADEQAKINVEIRESLRAKAQATRASETQASNVRATNHYNNDLRKYGRR